MNKYLKVLIIFLMAIATSVSFTKVYGDYQNYKFANNDEFESKYIRFQFNLSNRIDKEKNTSLLSKIAIENDLVLLGDVNWKSGYYNPNNLKWFDDKVENYLNKCKYKCHEVLKMEQSDLTVENGYTILSKNKIDDSVLEGLDLFVEDQENAHHEEPGLDTQRFIELYELYFIVLIMILTTFILLSFIILLKSLEKMKLQSIFGFKFITTVYDNLKETLFLNYLIYIVLSMIGIFIYSQDYRFPVMFVFYAFIFLMVLSFIFLIISFVLHKSLSRGSNIKFVKNSIYILSIIIVVFNITIINLSVSVK